MISKVFNMAKQKVNAIRIKVGKWSFFAESWK